MFSFFSFSEQAKDYSAKKKKEMKQKISFHLGKRNDYGGELSKNDCMDDTIIKNCQLANVLV